MPKELTHWILAEQALQRLGEGPVKRTVQEDRHIYYAGAVLPDTLLHIFRGPYDPAARTLANRFHDAHGNSYLPIIRAEAAFPHGIPPKLMACILGVLSHMQADMVLHPFVYAHSGKGDIGKHYRLETAIDVRFLRRGLKPPAHRLTQLVNKDREVLLEATALLFDPERTLPRQALEHALALHCRFQGMYSRPAWKLAAKALARVVGPPFREQQHLFYPLTRRGGGTTGGDGETWHCPVTGDPHSASIEELSDQVVERTAALFTRIESTGSLAAALHDPPGGNLLTGRHGVGQSHMR
ncbi:zinc dependent phospholipase C family protein [Geomonas sp. RF6]|uniref:zinc dependent phospholipase C family protein n=1 Tax=Geomonas sp. RF6 TaxID=2897342 RepID=UPI001E5EAE36|nr:zinc dependent phospholipase C family protein [Geomonas sp. RF6]UFS70354.1 zinc dependent phospholipase C family protein [Geomonas sp. RF6]